jgi:hypothetical protein
MVGLTFLIGIKYGVGYVSFPEAMVTYFTPLFYYGYGQFSLDEQPSTLAFDMTRGP